MVSQTTRLGRAGIHVKLPPHTDLSSDMLRAIAERHGRDLALLYTRVRAEDLDGELPSDEPLADPRALVQELVAGDYFTAGEVRWLAAHPSIYQMGAPLNGYTLSHGSVANYREGAGMGIGIDRRENLRNKWKYSLHSLVRYGQYNES